MKVVTSIWKPIFTLMTIDVQNYEEVFIMTEDDEAIYTDDEIGNLSKIPPLRKN